MKTMPSKDKKILQNLRKESHISKLSKKQSTKQFKAQSPVGLFKDKGLFGSNRYPSLRSKKQSRALEAQGVKNSYKVITTNESNNCFQSKIHQSIFYCENKEPNEQYFHSLFIKPNKTKRADSRSLTQKSVKLKNLCCKLKQMQQLVLAQDRQLGQLKGTISEKQLHRLIKMHSIERLKVILTVKIKQASKHKHKQN